MVWLLWNMTLEHGLVFVSHWFDSQTGWFDEKRRNTQWHVYKKCLCCIVCNTHIVACIENLLKVRIHVMMVHCHEQCINYDAKCDEQFHEGVEDDECE